jgi:hypothetical protein
MCQIDKLLLNVYVKLFYLNCAYSLNPNMLSTDTTQRHAIWYTILYTTYI